MLRAILLKHPVPDRVQRFLMRGLYLALVLSSGAALAAVSQIPLFLAQPPKPNVMFTLDNSGSMEWGSVTGYDGSYEYTATSNSDSTGPLSNATRNTRGYYSSSYNGLWYNPAVTYVLPVDYLGNSYAKSTTTAAPLDPYPTTGASYGSNTVDLTTTCYAANTLPTLPLYTYAKSSSTWSVSQNTTNCKTSSTSGYTTKVARYAFYYVWNGTTNLKTATPADTAFPTRVDIISTTATYPQVSTSTRTDCGTGACTYAQEIQNFANWYTYYRTRILMTKTAIGLAFNDIDPVVTPVNPSKFRVGFNAINNASSNSNTAVTDDGGWLTIRDFDATQKQSFYTKLYAVNPNGGTPLLTQMNRIGQLYQKKLTGFDYTGNDPYRASAADQSMVSCRPSYHIMSTDGYWNDSPLPSLPSGVSASLASIADFYYKTDLRPDLTDNVKPTNTRDIATWQHMTTFTIGLGADGTIPYSDTEPTTWPTPVANQSTTIDDLWHAAVVGKGRYFSAKNPVQLQSGLVAVLKDIAIQPGAAASGAITGSAISGDSLFYAPSFESGKWVGHLKAYSLGITGAVGALQWDAAAKLPAWNARNVVTWNPTTNAAVNFAWANLTTGSGSQQAALTSTDVLDYLKGNGAKEQTSDGNGPGIYRYRENKLGDIVNSSPLYVKKSDFGYRVLPAASGGSTTYNTFVKSKASRTAMLYAGANDGMLHGFDAATGVETFAFVPNAIYPNLISLSSPDYGHQYYVDGLLTEGDAYLGSAWKTILLGSIGAGGSSIFAVDITDPAALGAGKVLWEVKGGGTDDFADMGRVMGQLTVVRLRNGAWGAIFGNGYDSKNGKAVLYVIDLSTGALIKSFDVAPSVVGNGMAAPALLFNNQRELVAAYAGDLKGNLWKFDFDNISADSWGSSKLFSAVNADNKVQPMVKRPALKQHPEGGYMVTVATGKFMEDGDKANVDVQSIYGIWDKGDVPAVAVTGRSQLIQQTFTAATGGRTLSANTVDWTTKRGWYVDLSLIAGERVIGDLEILDNAVFATTLAPVSDACTGGGVSQYMAINYLSGQGELVFTDAGLEVISSVAIPATVANPVRVWTGGGKWKMIINTTSGDPVPGPGGESNAVFRTWHQLTIKN